MGPWRHGCMSRSGSGAPSRKEIETNVATPSGWGEKHLKAMCDAYSTGRDSRCPECGGAVHTHPQASDDERLRNVMFACSGCGREARENFRVLDPRDFIRQPFTACPGCGEPEFGRLMVLETGYMKRCRKCRHTETYPLPPLKKKLIYLDQMAVSNMMLALNPDTDEARKRRVDPFWKDLFKKLDILCKLQVIVCPASWVHEDESLAHEHFSALRRMYEHLSYGVRFQDFFEIEGSQIALHARSWLAGHSDEVPQLPRSAVLTGEPDAWVSVLHVTAHSKVTEEAVRALREWRDGAHAGIKSVFENWKSEDRKSFRELFKRECAQGGEAIVTAFESSVGRMGAVALGLAPFSLEAALPSPPAQVFLTIRDDFKRSGLSDQQATEKVREYLASGTMCAVPSVKTSCMIWAAIARRAAGGMKRPPSRGVFNDIALISGVLPFADAVFLDHEMQVYLDEQPLRTDLGTRGRVFSNSNRVEFMTMLDALEASVTPEHRELVATVYGPSWSTPYDTLLGPTKRE